MAEKSNEASIQEVIDREAIRTLPVRYCHHVWRKDPDSWANLFTDDGEISTTDPSMPRAHGREAVRKMIASGLDTSQPRPFIHNHVVELLGPDRAKGTCYVEVRLLRDGKKHYMTGWYDDEYAKERGEWKFKSRRINIDSMAPAE
jgi:ketosteroid isomerase-like protein